MTVSKTTSSATFFGNGTATAFSLPFYVASSDALRLYMVDEDGALTQLLSGVSFVGNKTAETTALTFTTAPVSGTEFYAVRETSPSQLVSLKGQVSYNPTVVEDVWDKLTRLVQEVQAGAGKLLRTTTVIPPIKLIGDRVLTVNAAGTEVICGPSVTEISEAAANAEAAAASAELAAEAAAAAALFDPDNFQPKDATLTSIAALGTAAGKIAYTTGVDTWAEAEITAAGRALLDDTDATAQRATLGLGAAATAGFLDEDGFTSDSATAAPSQQSTKAYVNAAIPAKLNASGSAPIYACRAWVNFDGTGTPAIRGAGNVSSITDNGVGDYTVNFATAMPDANYAAVGGIGSFETNTDNVRAVSGGRTSGSYRFKVGASVNQADSSETMLAFFR